MLGVKPLAAAVLACLLAAGCGFGAAGAQQSGSGPGWPEFRGDASRDGHPAGATLSAAEAARLAVAWRLSLSGAVDGSAVVAGEEVVIGSAGGDLVDATARSGHVRWRHSGLGAIVGSPAIDAGDVYAATLSGHVLAFSRRDGTPVWNFAAPGLQPAIWSSPVIFDGLVLVGVGSQFGDQPLEAGRVLAVRDGHEEWQFCVRDACAPGGGVWSTPAVDSDGRAFVGLGNPEDGLLAFDARTGRRLWQTAFYADDGRDLDVGGTPVLIHADGRELVAVGSDGGAFDAFDATTGKVVWSTDLVTGSAVHGLIASPASDGRDLFIGSASPPVGMFALSAQDGSEHWTHTLPLPVYSAPALGDGAMLFGDGNVFGETTAGAVFALDTADGHTLWTFEVHAAVRSGPIIAGNLVVVGDVAGDVFAFRPEE